MIRHTFNMRAAYYASNIDLMLQAYKNPNEESEAIGQNLYLTLELSLKDYQRMRKSEYKNTPNNRPYYREIEHG